MIFSGGIAAADGWLVVAQLVEDAEKGMEEMSKLYEEKGKKLYLPVG